MKYLLITAVGIGIVLVLAALCLVTFLGNSGSGYAVGVAVDPGTLLVAGLQLLCSLIIAYFVGPQTIKSIMQGQHWAYAGVKSLLICWAVPWFLLSTIAALPDLSWDSIMFNLVASLIPGLLMGLVVGYLLDKKIIK